MQKDSDWLLKQYFAIFARSAPIATHFGVNSVDTTSESSSDELLTPHATLVLGVQPRGEIAETKDAWF